MRKLVICSAGPALPEEAIVSKQAVIGMSGSGKTQTARKLAEAMMDIRQLRKRDYVLYGAGNYSLISWLERLR